MNDTLQRLEELEMRSAYQEDTINQLNDIVIKQQNLLDQLTLNVQQLQTRIHEQDEDTINNPSLQDEKPPHY